jgi:hypothetical protein
MKKISFALIISLILVLMVFSIGSAELPGTGWWSAFNIQNIGGSESHVSMTAYEKDSATTYTSATFSFNAGKALVYDPGITVNYPTGNVIGFTDPLPSGFEGSVVLQSSGEAASVVQIANYANGTVGGTGKASAMYQGVSSQMIATRLLAATIKHNYSNSTTTMYIQAAGSDAVVTVNYTMADGSNYSQTETILANRTFVFDPAGVGIPSTNCGFDTMTSPCYGSAIITSDAPIAGVLLEHPHSGAPITFAQAIRLSTPQDESTKIYVPSVKNEFCGSSGCGVAGAAVMNVGSGPANVTITLTVTKLGINAGTDVSIDDVFIDNAVIPAGENYNFSKWNNNLGGLPPGTMAAAVIESTNGEPLVGSSNDAKTQPGFPGQAKVKYAAFPDELATPEAYAPMVKEMLGIFTGGVTVQNVGTQQDYINIEYHQYGTNNICTLRTKDPVPVGGAAETNWVSVTGSSQFTISGDCSSFSELEGKEFSVKAYTDAGENIIIMVTQNTPNGTLDISRYEGVNTSGN